MKQLHIDSIVFGILLASPRRRRIAALIHAAGWVTNRLPTPLRTLVAAITNHDRDQIETLMRSLAMPMADDEPAYQSVLRHWLSLIWQGTTRHHADVVRYEAALMPSTQQIDQRLSAIQAINAEFRKLVEEVRTCNGNESACDLAPTK